MKQNLTIEGELHISIIIFGEFSIPLSIMDIATKQKINEDIENL